MHACVCVLCACPCRSMCRCVKAHACSAGTGTCSCLEPHDNQECLRSNEQIPSDRDSETHTQTRCRLPWPVGCVLEFALRGFIPPLMNELLKTKLPLPDPKVSTGAGISEGLGVFCVPRRAPLAQKYLLYVRRGRREPVCNYLP